MTETNEFNQLIGLVVENWQPLKLPAKQEMRGRFCSLKALDIEAHANPLFDALSFENQGESWTYLPYGPFNSYEDFRSWLRKKLAEEETRLYAILDNKTHHPIGICGYLRINPEHGTIEVGHLHFSKYLKKSPAATEAMYLMMDYVFEELKYRRYEWKCHSLNEASKKAAERLGFQFEGVFRQSNVFKNRNRDTAWFSILDSEWPGLKNKFKAWLSPDNFDAQGHQKCSLRNI